MKRIVDREQNLPAFACDVPSLQTLISALLAHFAGGEPRLSIDIKLKNEELSFNSIEELNSEQTILPDTVRDIWISIRDWRSDSARSVRVSSRYGDSPSVRAESDSTGWCAGATEITRDFAMRHKRWHAPLRPWMAWALALSLGFLPALLHSVGSRYEIRSLPSTIAQVSAIVLAWLIFFRFKSLFPPFELRIRTEQHLVRRYATEITVFAAAISAVAAVIALMREGK